MSYNSQLNENNEKLELLLQRVQDYPIKHPSKDSSYSLHSFYGEGTISYTFSLPFEPDAIYITSDAVALSKSEMFGMTLFPTTLSMLGGFIQFITKAATGTAFPTLGNMTMTGLTIFDRYSQQTQEDGTVLITITPYTNTTYGNKKFAEGVRYTIEAIKYNDLSPKERVTQYVSNLSTLGGAVTLNGAYVTEAMTKTEWEALMATRPEWTFTLWGETYG